MGRVCRADATTVVSDLEAALSVARRGSAREVALLAG